MIKIFRLIRGQHLSLTTTLGFMAALCGGQGLAADSSKVDFAQDIQPIFIKRCYECHGPDKQKSDLRLDHKPDAALGGKSGKAFWVPGKSAESQMIERVTTANLDDQMPPKGERLTPEQVRALRSWIDQGAIWPEEKAHWAFIKPARPALPVVENKRWVRNAIDNFILARLEKEKLSPSPEADRATLIRRLTLDLTGLPPSIAEVDAFLHDHSARAYEKLVDRLLASSHYGEHFARYWLDLARYADSNGYQVDLARSVWPTGIGSSMPLTRTCRSTSSPSSNSPAICCRTPPSTRKSPLAFIATRKSTTKAAGTRRNTAPKRSRIALPPPARPGWA
jgi:mono/diheme cytochrome c family protein